MSKGPQKVKGTQDIWGEAADRFNAVVAAFERVRKLFAFQRVEMPVFEMTEVFARSIGETTDIVSKEMYSFVSQGGDNLTLRPEFTAGIARAFLSNGWQQFSPMKLATHGPAFRYEQPQAGRYRQFHQLDAEIIGADSPTADVELLAFASQLLSELKIADGVTLELNTLGDAETRDAWRSALIAHFEQHRGDLSHESVQRLSKNPLRILDSKDPRDRTIAAEAPGIDQFLTIEAGRFFNAVQDGLQAAGIKSQRNARLVRGLDYYRHTTFEFVTDRLGAQGAVIAGGRYDGLLESLGGSHTPAVGWAAGIERLGMLLDIPSQDVLDVAILPLDKDEKTLSAAMAAAGVLRGRQVSADLLVRGKEEARFQRAKKAGVLSVLKIGSPFPGEPGVARLRIVRCAAVLDAYVPLAQHLHHVLGGRLDYDPSTDLSAEHLVRALRES